MTKELTTITMPDGIRLAAEVHTAAKSSSPPATILFVHGFGGNRSENGLFGALAEAAEAKGFDSILYDWRGIGDSEGNFPESTIPQHTADFQTVLRWARGRQASKNEKLFALGFSLGAAVVGLALRAGAQLDGAVYLSPAVRPNKTMWPRYDIPEIWQQIEERGVAQKPGSDTLVGRPIVESLRDTDLGTKAFVLRVPLLVCHGTADSRIDISHSRELAARVPPGQTFRYTEYDGASHSFRPPEIHWEPLSQEFTTWLQDINNNPTTLHH